MGIAIPRPAMRKREAKKTEAGLRHHSTFMALFQARGMTRENASKLAAKMVRSGALPPGLQGYRVVYGESRPAWEQIFETMKQAKAFAKEHESFGDRIFSIKKTVPGEPPQSMTAAIEAAA